METNIIKNIDYEPTHQKKRGENLEKLFIKYLLHF